MLTGCKRSDHFLFQWYASLVDEPKGWRHARPLMQNVADARQEFTPSKANGFLEGSKLAPTNLVISHKVRERINKQCNEAEYKTKVSEGQNNMERFTIEEFGLPKPTQGQNEPQDAWFWPNQRVIACCRGRKLRNGREYSILELSSKVTAQAEDEEPIVLKRAEFFRAMRLRAAITYAGAQGLTIEGLVALHDTGHTHFDWRMLYVGLSRATGRDKVIVY